MKLSKVVFVLAVLIGFTCLQVNGQKKFPKVLYKKDSCYVYPYRITNFGKQRYYSSKNDFMPCTDSLPNGKFIVYGEEIKYKKHGFIFRRYKVKLDTTKIAVVFTAYNGMRNGPCWWYNEKGNMRSSGFYKNDSPDGMWINYTSDGKVFYISTYEDGIRNGPYVEYYENGNVSEMGQYVKGDAAGEWKTFHYNGNTECIYTLYPDSFGLPPKDYIWDPVYYGSGNNQSDICGKLYLFYDDGRLRSVRDYSFGHRKVNDTSYYYNGNLNEISKFMGFTEDSALLYSVEHYDYKDGSLENINYYKEEKKYKESSYYKGELITDEYYLSNYDTADTGVLLPYTIDYKAGKVFRETYIYKNPEMYNDYYFYRNPLEYGFVNDFSFELDSLSGNIYAQKHWYNKDSTYHLVKYYSGNSKKGIVYDSSLLYTNGKLFTGKYFYKNRRNGKKFPEFRISDNKLVEIDYNHHWSFYRNSTELSGSGDYLNGKENGDFVYLTNKRRTVKLKTYKNGLLDGDYTEYQMCRIQNGKHKRRQWCVEKQKTYKNGLLDGTLYEYGSDGTVVLVEPYKEGKLNGERLCYSYDEGLKKYYLYKRSHYLSDSLDGTFEKYYSSGQLDESGVYKNDKKEGVFYSYNSDGSKYQQLNYSNGFLSGDNYEYFNTPVNVVKLIVHYDANDSVVSGKYSDFIALEKCLYTSYYKDGVKKSSEGRYGYRYSKTGIWNYWDDNGTLIKQSDYYFGKVLNTLAAMNEDSISISGKIIEWYSNGNKKTEGYILDETSEYDCRIEQDVSIEDIYYVNFWSEDGTQLIKDKNGKLNSYYPGGTLKTQTIIKEGLKEGEYKEWDPSGRLTKIGQYKNGLAEGRWLSGDLEGIGYVNNECFTSEEDFENAMRASKENVSVTVTYYDKGTYVKESTFYKNGSNYEWDESF